MVAGVLISSIALFSCGGSEGDSVTDKEDATENEDATDNEDDVDSEKSDLIKSLASTSWERACFPVYDGEIIVNYNNATMDINSELQSTSNVEVYSAIDSNCSVVKKTISYTAQLEITEKIITEESIEAYGLNVIFISSPDITKLYSPYSLIYVASEKLYGGVDSGNNFGETPETRHSSISLDEYFSKVLIN